MLPLLLTGLLALAPAPGAPTGWFLAGDAKEYVTRTDPTGGCTGKSSAELSSTTAQGNQSGSVMQLFDAQRYRGKKLRFTVHLSGASVPQGLAFARVDTGTPPQPLLFQKSPHLAPAAQCQPVQVEFNVPFASSRVAVGVVLEGRGSLKFDAPHLEVVGPADEVDFADAPARGRVGRIWFNDGVIDTLSSRGERMHLGNDGSWIGRTGDFLRIEGDTLRVQLGTRHGTFQVQSTPQKSVIDGTWGTPQSSDHVHIEWNEQQVSRRWGSYEFQAKHYDTPQQDPGCWRYLECGYQTGAASASLGTRFDICGGARDARAAPAQTLVAFLRSGFHTTSKCL